MVRDQRGYAMAALLVAMSVMAIMMSIALPVWNTAARREKEEELIFRGQQYARAIALFQRRYPGTFPPNLDILLNEKFLRKRYRDPMTEDGEFQLIPAGAAIPGQGPQRGAPPQTGRGQAPGTLGQLAQETGGVPARGRGAPAAGLAQPGVQVGIMGVVSKSTAQSLRLFNGRDRYNEWAFVATQASTQAGAGAQGGAAPGARGRGGQAPGGRGVQPGRRGQPVQPFVPGPRRGGPPQQPGRGQF